MTLHDDTTDRPEAQAEIHRAFHDYEAALMRNDVAALNAWFWDDPRTTRYGIADRQLGYAQVAAHRATVPAPTYTRRLENLRLTCHGDDMAVAQVEFIATNSPLRGFQTQVWVRKPQGWKIVAAHVSMIDLPG